MGVNIPVVLGFLLGCVALEVAGSFCLNQWALRKAAKPWLFAMIGVVCYACIALLYGASLKHGSLSMNNALWQSVALIIVTLVGIGFFKDRLTLGQWVGVSIVSVGFIVLLSGSENFGTSNWFRLV